MKNLLIVSLAVILVSCTGVAPETNGEGNLADLTGKISLTTDKAIIKSDGTDAATLKVTLSANDGNEYDVTSYVDIYCDNESNPMEETAFSTSEAGEHTFYAVRGFEISNTIAVKAVDGIKDLPTDANESSYAFRHRMMLIQHTGTACPNCPRMMNLLKTLSSYDDYATSYYHVASHAYNSDDPAYSAAAASVSRTFDTEGWFPWLTFNLTEDNARDLEGIKSGIDSRHKEIADAGISAACTVIDSCIYANVSVKVGKTNNYRIAVWVLEDNINASQSGATSSWQNTHNNCLREMAGESKTERIYGTSAGKIEKGSEITYITSINTDSSWNLDNCKVIVILTADDGTGVYDLANCTVCHLEDTVEYEYIQ